MISVFGDALAGVVGVVLCAAFVVAWRWETRGRRAWQRELNRRDDERIREWRRKGRPLG